MGKNILIKKSVLNGVIKKLLIEGNVNAGELGKERIFSKIKPVKLSGQLFKNGVDQIDTASDAFNIGRNIIKSHIPIGGDKLIVTVQGGASAVGSPRYDNLGLAKRRAVNFINTIKPFFKNQNVQFIEGNHVVGKATIKNSPEANNEQFAKLSFEVKDNRMMRDQSIDNTAYHRGPEREISKFVNKTITIPHDKLNVIYAYIEKMGGKMV